MTELLYGIGPWRATAALLLLAGACSDSAASMVTDTATDTATGAGITDPGDPGTTSSVSLAEGDNVTAGSAASSPVSGQESPAVSDGSDADPAFEMPEGMAPAALGEEVAVPESTAPLTYAPCALEERVGRFALLSRPDTELAAMGTTQLNGFVRDGVRPADLDEVLMQEGECRLVTGPDLLCDPRCAVSEVCTTDGSCIAAPTSQDVGTISVAGTATAIQLVPNTANNYLPEVGTTIDYAPYDLGAELALSAPGGSLAPFVLRGHGVEMLELEEGEWLVAMDQPLTLRWQAPAESNDAVRIVIELDIAHHGGVDAQIACDVADTGTFDIPATLINGLLERGVAGFPAVTLTRRSVDSTAVGAGCVEFVVASETSRDVSIPGLVSCGSDDDCSDGQRCNVENLTCAQ